MPHGKMEQFLLSSYFYRPCLRAFQASFRKSIASFETARGKASLDPTFVAVFRLPVHLHGANSQQQWNLHTYGIMPVSIF